jgi:putative transposase
MDRRGRRPGCLYRARQPRENGFIGSFNARLHDEVLDGEICYTLAEAKIVIESWRRHFNTPRPHGSLGFKPPAPEVFIPSMPAPAPGPTVHPQSPWTSR